MDTTYPLPESPEHDTRFNLLMTLDVMEVLNDHGYPKATAMDVAELQVALLRFLYRSHR